MYNRLYHCCDIRVIVQLFFCCLFQIKFLVNSTVVKKPNLQRQKKVFTKHKGLCFACRTITTQHLCGHDSAFLFLMDFD